MPDVFLSYGHTDTEIAIRLREQLSAAGIDVFWHQNIHSGSAWMNLVSSAIAEAKLFVLLLPSEADLVGPIQKEMSAASARSAAGNLRMLPVLLPGREPARAVSNFAYMPVDSEHDFSAVVNGVRQALHDGTHVAQSGGDLRLSFLMSLLDSDLGKAPLAAAIVLDEVASSVGGSTGDIDREISLLRQADEWAERIFGPHHRSVASLQYQLNAALLRAGRYEESVDFGSRMLQKAETQRERLELNLSLGYALFQSGHLRSASDRYHDALRAAEASGSASAQATSLVALGTIARTEGDLELAERHYVRALELSVLSDQPSGRVGALVGLCELALQEGDTDAGSRWANEAVWVSRTALAGDDPLALRAAAAALQAAAGTK